MKPFPALKYVWVGASIFLCVASLISCSDSKTTPSYPKENPLTGYITAGAFQAPSSEVNGGDYEFGFSFKPLVDGNITDLIARIPDNATNLRVTIWNATTKAVLRTETIASVSTGLQATKSITPLALTKNTTYLITFNSNDWYDYELTSGDIAYPIAVGNISITGYGYADGTDQTYPTDFPTDYYAGDLTFNFQRTK